MIDKEIKALYKTKVINIKKSIKHLFTSLVARVIFASLNLFTLKHKSFLLLSI